MQERAFCLAMCMLSVIVIACAPEPHGRDVSLGTVEQGPGGQITRAKIAAVCSEPAPAIWSDQMQQKLEGVFKLQKVEIAKLNDELSRNLQSFTGTTAQGNDIRAILFYICQISTVRGLSEEATTELLTKAMNSWTDISLKNKDGGIPSQAFRLEQEIRQHLLLGFYNDALKEANELVKLRPNDGIAYRLKGIAHYKLREYSSAVTAFRIARERDPRQESAARFNEASALLALGDYQTARQHFEMLSHEDPSDMSIHYNLAIAYMSGGDLPAAKNQFGIVYNSGTNFKPRAVLGLGITYLLTNDSKGVDYLREAVCVRPQLRGLFLGKLEEDSEERYEPYIRQITKLRTNKAYAEFLKRLEDGKQC